jgi:hypothetical protein
MNKNEKTQLEEIKEQLKDEDYQDNTEYIRQAKNSGKIRDDIISMERLKRSYKGDIKSEEFAELCKAECKFLYDNYMYMFNKMLKDVMDMTLMFRFLQVLREIEDGKLNQDEGSVIVGKMLKNMYIDCANREGAILDEQNKREEPAEGKSINWKQYKMRNIGK